MNRFHQFMPQTFFTMIGMNPQLIRVNTAENDAPVAARYDFTLLIPYKKCKGIGRTPFRGFLINFFVSENQHLRLRDLMYRVYGPKISCVISHLIVQTQYIYSCLEKNSSREFDHDHSQSA
jgi:hypothetical protein